MRKSRFPPFGSVFTEFELWEALARQFVAFFDLGCNRQRDAQGPMSPFGSVFAEFEWEALLRQFLGAFDFSRKINFLSLAPLQGIVQWFRNCHF